MNRRTFAVAALMLMALFVACDLGPGPPASLKVDLQEITSNGGD